MPDKSASKTPAKQDARYADHPILSLWEDMDRMFARHFRTPTTYRALGKAIDWPISGETAPQVDVKETKKAVTISAELPGMEEKDIELTVHDGYLTLKGEKKEEIDKDEENVHVMERRYGAFRRTFPIGQDIEVDKISAKFDKGVLKITLPKNGEVKLKACSGPLPRSGPFFLPLNAKGRPKDGLSSKAHKPEA